MVREIICDQCRKKIESNKLIWLNDIERNLDFCSKKCHSKWNSKDRNWKEIHSDFTPKLRKEWEERGFSYEKCKEWIDFGAKSTDASFCAWLRDEVEVEPVELSNKYQEADLREQFREYLKEKSRRSTWKLILQLRNRGFFWKEVEELVNAGLRVEEVDLIWWLRDTKSVDVKQILYHRNDEQVKEDYLTSSWHNKGFTDEEISTWRSAGLGLQDGGYVTWIKDVLEITPAEYSSYLSEGNDDRLLREQWQRFLEERRIADEENLKGGLQAVWKEQKFSYEDIRIILANMELKETDPIFWKGDYTNEQVDIMVSKVMLMSDFAEKKWKDIHPEFTIELQKEWKSKNFSYEEAKEWISAGLMPKDAYYAQWLRDIAKKSPKDIFNYNFNERMRKQYKEYWEKKQSKISFDIFSQIKNFPHSYNGTKRFSIKWTIKLTPSQQLLVNKLIVNPELRDRYVEKGLCWECCQPNTGNFFAGWCQTCCSRHFKDDFGKWTSGDLEIDKFIQNYQLEADSQPKVLEWIPYEQFTNIKYLAQGGFGKVYEAYWGKGYVWCWSIVKNEWERANTPFGGRVALKILHNSQNITTDFLREITHNKLIDNSSFIVRCFGISQDPTTKNYIMVMEYATSGSLRESLKSYSELELKDKIARMMDIASGLRWIHDKGLTHRDFHPGNILSYHEAPVYLVTDLGLSRPANEVDKGKVYGILPYVAPEVLKDNSYTQVADVYSFGIIAYELLANAYPYPEMNDIVLASKVCQGYRPNIDKIPIPQLLKDLIKRCWDTDPEKRPDAEELGKTICGWWNEVEYKQITKFGWQYQAIKDEYNRFSKRTPYQIHLTAPLNSKRIDTKQIANLLQKSQEFDEWFGSDNDNFAPLYPQSIINEDVELNVSTEILANNTKRQLSLETQTKTNQGESKSVKISREITNEPEKMELDNHKRQSLNFTPSLINEWANHSFSPSQTQDWLSIGLQPTDHHLVAFLRDQKHLTPEEVLNHGNEQGLRTEFLKSEETQTWLTEINSKINQIEKEIKILKKPLNEESIKTLEKFIEVNKKIIRNEEDNQSRKEIKELYKKIEDETILKRQEIEKVIVYCERLVDLEWQKELLSKNSELKEFQVRIEIPPKK